MPIDVLKSLRPPLYDKSTADNDLQFPIRSHGNGAFLIPNANQTGIRMGLDLKGVFEGITARNEDKIDTWINARIADAVKMSRRSPCCDRTKVIDGFIPVQHLSARF